MNLQLRWELFHAHRAEDEALRAIQPYDSQIMDTMPKEIIFSKIQARKQLSRTAGLLQGERANIVNQVPPLLC